MKLEFSRQTFEKYSNIIFHGTPSSGSRVVACGRTDRRTDMTKLIVAFRIISKVSKNRYLPLQNFTHTTHTHTHTPHSHTTHSHTHTHNPHTRTHTPHHTHKHTHTNTQTHTHTHTYTFTRTYKYGVLSSLIIN